MGSYSYEFKRNKVTLKSDHSFDLVGDIKCYVYASASNSWTFVASNPNPSESLLYEGKNQKTTKVRKIFNLIVFDGLHWCTCKLAYTMVIIIENSFHQGYVYILGCINVSGESLRPKTSSAMRSTEHGW